VSESAVRDKPLLVYGLARNRRSPKRPSEPAAKRAFTRKRRSGEKMRSLLSEWRLMILCYRNVVRS
jgi:hypothetical protein